MPFLELGELRGGRRGDGAAREGVSEVAWFRERRDGGGGGVGWS